MRFDLLKITFYRNFLFQLTYVGAQVGNALMLTCRWRDDRYQFTKRIVQREIVLESSHFIKLNQRLFDRKYSIWAGFNQLLKQTFVPPGVHVLQLSSNLSTNFHFHGTAVINQNRGSSFSVFLSFIDSGWATHFCLN